MIDVSQRVRVTAPYVSAVTAPVRFAAGEAVAVGRHDQQWTAYVWGTDQAGHAGWVPEAYLQMTGPCEAVAHRDYDATELTVSRGEHLDVLDEAGGWLLCRSAAGLVGWVPSNHLEALD
jgi:hypothetical protein